MTDLLERGGYGDVIPITPLGKFFGSCITIIGVGMVALPAGIIASGFSDNLRQRRTSTTNYESLFAQLLNADVSAEDKSQLVRELAKNLHLSEATTAGLLEKAIRR